MNTPQATTEGTFAPQGTFAPDLMLTAANGTAVRLASLWHSQPLLIFFMRHFGCALCRAELLNLRKRYSEIQERGGDVAVITPTDAPAAAEFTRQQQLPFRVFADLSRNTYRAFGLYEGTLADAVGPTVLVRHALQALKGNIAYINPAGPSVKQLGGVFVVGRDGTLHLKHVALPIYYYPPFERYLEALDAAGGA